VGNTKFVPQDADFSDHIPQERPVLFHFEFSRECPAIWVTVELIRRNGPKHPEHYLPGTDFAQFGWPEWPREPYTSIPQKERIRRLVRSLRAPSDRDKARKLDPTWSYLPSSDPVIPVRIPSELTPTEAGQLFEALYRVTYGQSRPERAKGRRAMKAIYEPWLAALSAKRLRDQGMTATQAIDFLKRTKAWRPFSSKAVFNRAARNAEDYIARFCEQARQRAFADIWFPPFGPHLLSL
jgi:hypothetical protein